MILSIANRNRGLTQTITEFPTLALRILGEAADFGYQPHLVDRYELGAPMGYEHWTVQKGRQYDWARSRTHRSGSLPA